MGAYVTDYSRHKNGIVKYIEENHPKRLRFRDYRKDWDSIELIPKLLFLLLETTSKCNLKCPMCLHSTGYDNSEYMSDDLFNVALNSIEDMKIPSISMNYSNEPLLDDSIVQRINRVSGLDCVLDTFMNTNATLLTEQKSEEILNSKLTRLLIGFDAFTEETYKKIRIGAEYEKVFTNIQNFIKMKKKMKKRLPVLRISLVKLSINEHEINDWLAFWKNKVDQACIQEYVTPVIDSSKDFLLAHSNLRKINKKESETCIEPFKKCVIRSNGDILPCCSYLAAKIPIGNIKEDTLRGAWYGKQAEEIRELFKQNTWREHRVCGKCLSVSNGYLYEYKKRLNKKDEN